MAVERFRMGANREKWERADGDFYRVWEDVDAVIEMDIDLQAVRRLIGERCIRSYRGKVTALAGAVKARIVTESITGTRVEDR